MSGCRNHTIWFEDTEQVLIAQAQDAAGRQSAERLDAGADQRGPLVAAEGFDRDGIGHQLPGVVRREDQAGEAPGHGRAARQTVGGRGWGRGGGRGWDETPSSRGWEGGKTRPAKRSGTAVPGSSGI